MNKLDLLLMRWREGSIKDPDLLLCLNYINNIKLDKLNERKPTDIQRPDTVFGEDPDSKLKRPKAKGFRQGFQSGSDRTNAENQGSL